MKNNTQLTTLEFYQGELKFSAGHFTIFSKTHREHLHGHNYLLSARVVAELQEPGLSFDYRVFKQTLLALCDSLNARFLLAGESPYLKIEERGEYYEAHFNEEKIPFLKRDALILPLSNITLEELSRWFVQALISDKAFMEQQRIHALTIKVFNGPEHSAAYAWVL